MPVMKYFIKRYIVGHHDHQFLPLAIRHKIRLLICMYML